MHRAPQVAPRNLFNAVLATNALNEFMTKSATKRRGRWAEAHWGHKVAAAPSWWPIDCRNDNHARVNSRWRFTHHKTTYK